MERGSEWSKWDLHIHTPGTAKNDNFKSSGDVWEEYIQRLENSDIAVFGITDYFSIKNYLKVKECQKSGRLMDKCILPNVELRITPVTGKNRPINMHVIFDPSLTENELNREFFSKLSIIFKNANYSCLEDDLITYGRELKGDGNYPNDAAIKEAINNMVIPYQQIYNIVRDGFLKNKVIIAVSSGSNDGISGLSDEDEVSTLLNQGEGTMKTTRQEIIRMSDIILSGNPKVVGYFLGKTTSKNEVIKSYGNIKPCITSSDAHSMDKVGQFHNNRITWIKADPTFEGLKQILFEPEERVIISDIKPDVKYDYNVIDYVDLNYSGTWHQRIYFNQNLNTIIGGRSTGKSNLLASIAAKLNVKGIENTDYISLLCDNMHVMWRDGQVGVEKSLEYFPQNFFSNIKDSQYTELLLQILLNDTFKKDKHERYKVEISRMFHEIQSKVTQYFEKRRLYIEKKESLKNMGDIKGIELEITKLKKERDEIQSILIDKKEILDSYKGIECELKELLERKEIIELDIANLKQINTQQLIVYNDDISMSVLSKDSADWLFDVIKVDIDRVNNHLHSAIQQKITKLQETQSNIFNEIKKIQGTAEYKQGEQVFVENNNLSAIVKSLGILNNKLSKMTLVQKEVLTLRKEYTSIAQELLDMHVGYLDIMNDITSELYMQHDEIKLKANVTLKDSFRKTLEECLSLRMSRIIELIDTIIKEYDRREKTRIRELAYDLMNRAVNGEILFKNGYDIKTFVSKILSECWYDISLDVEYDGDNLKDMSPGKRAFVILKLLLDFSNKECPILIDQPEDNLDNRAIYNELVKYIRKKKKERQIILVTHNPNIVVGADSEEVIVANQHGKNAPNENGIKFQYVTGSLENSRTRSDDETIPILSRCGIREHVCDILEGGEEAFKKRENKYGF